MKIGIAMPREELYRRIDERVDRMIEAGLVDEVRSLLDRGVTRKATAMQGLGYKEIAAALSGEIDMDEAIRIIKRDTRHFAKRQFTWYSREKEVHFYARDQHPDMEDLLGTIIDDYHLFTD